MTMYGDIKTQNKTKLAKLAERLGKISWQDVVALKRALGV